MSRCAAAMSLLLGFVVFHAHAQDSLYVRGGDTLRYSYTPLSEEAYIPNDTTVKKPNIFHRIVDYFERSSQDRTFEKKIDFTFIFGPNYSKDTQFGIGGLAAGLYRIDRTDSVTMPSNISIFADVSTTGFYMLGISGNNIFRSNRSRLEYTLSLYSEPTDYWGIGYRAGAYNEKSKYREKRYQVTARYLYGVLRNMFVGGVMSFEYTKGIKFTNIDYIEGQSTHYNAAGIGAVLQYDSRDFIPNPYKGVYVSLEQMLYPKGLGNCDQNIWSTTFTADYYHTLWKGGVVAVDLYGEFNSDGTPWPMLARLGGSKRMRGYYSGRYNDNDMITFQVELRQRIYRRIGAVVWGGAGNVFPDFSRFRWDQTLPNYGIGLRWEFKKRVNVRLDYGFGRKTNGFLVNINEAF